MANLDFILFLQKRDDIQAVRGRGLAMARKSKGNAGGKPKEENAKRSEILFLCFLCSSHVMEEQRRQQERDLSLLTTPLPSVQFSAHLTEQEHDATVLLLTM